MLMAIVMREGMMKRILLVALIAILPVAQSADIEKGREKAGVCNACHGKNGIGTTPIYPNLAGQKAAYFIKQIKAFKDGSRSDATMKMMSIPLNDEDIANLAAYYASLSVNGK